MCNCGIGLASECQLKDVLMELFPWHSIPAGIHISSHRTEQHSFTTFCIYRRATEACEVLEGHRALSVMCLRTTAWDTQHSLRRREAPSTPQSFLFASPSPGVSNMGPTSSPTPSFYESITTVHKLNPYGLLQAGTADLMIMVAVLLGGLFSATEGNGM